jgi:hypothetical protein
MVARPALVVALALGAMCGVLDLPCLAQTPPGEGMLLDPWGARAPTPTVAFAPVESEVVDPWRAGRTERRSAEAREIVDPWSKDDSSSSAPQGGIVDPWRAPRAVPGAKAEIVDPWKEREASAPVPGKAQPELLDPWADRPSIPTATFPSVELMDPWRR